MQICVGSNPIKSIRMHTNTDDATLVASDLQAGVTGYAKGRKITGTGKTFSFATYGKLETNFFDSVPEAINIIHIGSSEYPVKMTVVLSDMKNLDFEASPKVAEVNIDGATYPITVKVQDGEFAINCDKTFEIQVFYGKDNYV